MRAALNYVSPALRYDWLREYIVSFLTMGGRRFYRDQSVLEVVAYCDINEKIYCHSKEQSLLNSEKVSRLVLLGLFQIYEEFHI